MTLLFGQSPHFQRCSYACWSPRPPSSVFLDTSHAPLSTCSENIHQGCFWTMHAGPQRWWKADTMVGIPAGEVALPAQLYTQQRKRTTRGEGKQSCFLQVLMLDSWKLQTPATFISVQRNGYVCTLAYIPKYLHNKTLSLSHTPVQRDHLAILSLN